MAHDRRRFLGLGRGLLRRWRGFKLVKLRLGRFHAREHVVDPGKRVLIGAGRAAGQQAQQRAGGQNKRKGLFHSVSPFQNYSARRRRKSGVFCFFLL